MLDTIFSIFSLIVQSGLLIPALLFGAGFVCGCWFYRYMLRRNPQKLERWAADAKALAILAKIKAKEKL